METPAASRAVLAALAGVAALGTAGPAAAQEGLREGLFKHRPTPGRSMATPPVARYVSDTGQVFILDRSQTRPLLRFEDSPEIWHLEPQSAPRGDIIFKNDLGEPMLRATRLGGFTLFTEQRPEGSAVALAGPGSPLRLAPLSPMAVGERLLQASVRSGRSARHTIVFDAPDFTPAGSALIADAATVASVAVVRVAERKDGAKVLSRLSTVLLLEGRRSSAQFADKVLKITVAPALGFAGRPSSEKVAKVLAGGD